MLNERAAHSSRLLGILSITLRHLPDGFIGEIIGKSSCNQLEIIWKIIWEIIPFETLRKQNPTGRSSKSNKLMTNMV